MIKRSITFMTLALALTTLCQAQSRKVINLPSWDFSRDGKAWQQVAVPHDWAISGPFDKKWTCRWWPSSRMAKPKRPRSRDVLVRCLG